MPTVLSFRNNSEGYVVRSSSYVIVLIVIILRDRADTVTAGVLTKEIFFFS